MGWRRPGAGDKASVHDGGALRATQARTTNPRVNGPSSQTPRPWPWLFSKYFYRETKRNLSFLLVLLGRCHDLSIQLSFCSSAVCPCACHFTPPRVSASPKGHLSLSNGHRRSSVHKMCVPYACRITSHWWMRDLSGICLGFPKGVIRCCC